MIDINKSGGPANPTLSGGQLRDGSFRWEGLCLFDIYFTSLLKSGKNVSVSFSDAVEAMRLRNEHIIVEDKDTNDKQ